MATTPTSSMYLDVLKYQDDVFADERLNEIKAFHDYIKNQERQFDVNAIITYVVLLYSKDSILNKKPMAQLKDRRVRAATLAGLNVEQTTVQELLFDLLSEPVRDLIIDYLLWQNDPEWTERCIIDAQLEENRRIRLKPIQNKTTTPAPKKKRKKDEEEFDIDGEVDPTQDDNYIITASDKKFKLTTQAEEYSAMIKKLDLIIFLDHDQVKSAAIRRKRNTLESMAG